MSACGETLRGMESAVAIAPKDENLPERARHKLRLSVSIQIRHRKRFEELIDGKTTLRLEAPVAIAKQQRDIGRVVVCGDNVQKGVGIYISHRHRRWKIA